MSLWLKTAHQKWNNQKLSQSRNPQNDTSSDDSFTPARHTLRKAAAEVERAIPARGLAQTGAASKRITANAHESESDTRGLVFSVSPTLRERLPPNKPAAS
jgi:hypothetical protein